jgi:hypothetical protein
LDSTGRHRLQNWRSQTTHVPLGPAQDGNLAQYLEVKAIPQVKELLSNYGEFPAIIWFDTLGCDTLGCDDRQIPCRWTVRIA